MPYAAALALGLVDEVRCRSISDGEPIIPLEGVRMGREMMFVSWRKAESELDYIPGRPSTRWNGRSSGIAVMATGEVPLDWHPPVTY